MPRNGSSKPETDDAPHGISTRSSTDDPEIVAETVTPLKAGFQTKGGRRGVGTR